ncbi:MAG: NAD-dependent deacetylase, partial [Lachnospiraceae bacterium]|nr:NAD-dependent deacetylase [Lachnospiraceae bacterium]
LILGTNLKTYLCEQLVGYYNGNKMVLVSLNNHFSDKNANLVIHKRVDETLDDVLNCIKCKRNI